MGNIAISVENLGKCYRIGHAEKRPENFRAALRSFAVAPFEYLRSHLREPSEDELFWALKDVSFEVKHGEVLGIIGRNGAGKSTLLKILSRITEPTTGRARVYGRVGSLLEVGTGFHPELTGRENIYLNGTILGMKRAEIDKKFDEIVDFSGIEKFLDTPVKRYSSGMYVRLAFSVAAHLEPEILLVDEVLAVGDIEFQKKCLGKMENVAQEGRTVLFISHNMIAVEKLCKKVIWLHSGILQDYGENQTVIARYLRTSFTSCVEQVWDILESAPGNDIVRLHAIRIRPDTNSSLQTITMHTPLMIEVAFWNLWSAAYLDITLHLCTENGVVAFGTGTLHEPAWHGRPFPKGLFRSICYIPGDLLNSGIHRVNVLVVQNQSALLFIQEDALIFEVAETPDARGGWYGKLAGVVRPKLQWITECITQ